jgi:hypothetical protein
MLTTLIKTYYIDEIGHIIPINHMKILLMKLIKFETWMKLGA